MRLPFKVYNDHAQDTGVLTPSSTNDDSATSLAAEALFVADSPFRQSRERLSPQIVVKHRRRIPHPVTQDPPPLALHPAEDAASASETPPTETSVRVHLRAHPATTPVGTLPGQEESPAPSASEGLRAAKQAARNPRLVRQEVIVAPSSMAPEMVEERVRAWGFFAPREEAQIQLAQLQAKVAVLRRRINKILRSKTVTPEFVIWPAD